MLLRAFAALVVATLVGTLTVRAGSSAPGPSDWDKAAAARYLDSRMDAWWTRAKTLRTGSGDTKCLSCHTPVPYALARPALRRVLGVASPTVHELKILDVVRQRVEHVATQQPYYDHTEDKKVESRGVEAVLNALMLTQLETPGLSAPSPATRAAMARLWVVQRADGAWDWLNFGLEPYEAPDAVFHGATLAALSAGSPAGADASREREGQAGIERLRGYLRANLASQRLFNRVWAMLASSRLSGIMTPAERDGLVRELESRQHADGGWALVDLGPWRWTRAAAPFSPPGTTDAALLSAADGYATGLVVYAMKQAGISADRPSVVKGVTWLRTNQRATQAYDPSWAPWRAHSINFDREHGGEKGEPWRRMFMSDLATSFAVLALLE
jgi:hypothetical protein